MFTLGGVAQVPERSGPNLVEKRQCENSQLNEIQFSSVNTLPMMNILKLTVTSSAKMKTCIKTLDNKLNQEKYLEGSNPFVCD